MPRRLVIMPKCLITTILAGILLIHGKLTEKLGTRGVIQMVNYYYLVVGAGLFGATFAY